jgi:hypothetical protein
MQNILDFLNLVQSGGMPQAQPNYGLPQQPVMGNTASQTPQNNDLVQQLLTARFQPEPNLHDTASSVFQGALAHKYIDPQSVASQGIADSITRLKTISDIQENVAKANLYSQGGSGSQTLKIAQGLMAENPGLTLADAVALAKSSGSTPLTVKNGQITNLSGSVDAAGNMAYGKTGGSKRAEITTEAQANLPTVVDQAQTSINVIKDAINHPGMPANFGMSGLVPNRPGSASSDAKALLEQIKGGSFLTAYGQLRGGGQISNVEGTKAEQAYARMQTSQSFDAFKKAAQDYVNIIQKAVNRTKNTASGAIFDNPNTTPAQPVVLQGATDEDPRIQKARDAGYSDDEIQQYLSGGQ